MTAFRTNRNTRCPACQTALTGATAVNLLAAPQPGDLSVCCHCTQLLIFNTDITVRQLTDEEFNALPYEVRFNLAVTREMLVRMQQAYPLQHLIGADGTGTPGTTEGSM